LGSGFDLNLQRPVLVAGGMGAAPLACAAAALARRGNPARLLLGLASRQGWEGLLGRMRDLVSGLVLASEDGSAGQRGLVTDLLRPALEQGGHDAVLACGPLGMLGAVAAICARHTIPCQVSLEAPMACGVGACLGCAIPVMGGGYARACQEGPVFDARAVDWGRL
jgi:dihydroorotate dehydrogenase electron transfer subunit